MIQVKRKADGTLRIVSGHHQLFAQLHQTGSARVVDASSGEPFYIFEDGKSAIALTVAAMERVERETRELLSKVMGRPPQIETGD